MIRLRAAAGVFGREGFHCGTPLPRKFSSRCKNAGKGPFMRSNPPFRCFPSATFIRTFSMSFMSACLTNALDLASTKKVDALSS